MWQFNEPENECHHLGRSPYISMSVYLIAANYEQLCQKKTAKDYKRFIKILLHRASNCHTKRVLLVFRAALFSGDDQER
jgi:hypothetical protein